jgi:hypothetical protein
LQLINAVRHVIGLHWTEGCAHQKSNNKNIPLNHRNKSKNSVASKIATQSRKN